VERANESASCALKEGEQAAEDFFSSLLELDFSRGSAPAEPRTDHICVGIALSAVFSHNLPAPPGWRLV
jgi:hypothetical protein